MIDKVKFREASLPDFKEVISRKEYVGWGNTNMLPQDIVKNYENSALFRACITALVNGTNGQELVGEEPKDDLRLIQANPYESVYDVFKKVALDYILTGNFFLNVVWKEDRDLGIADIYHIDSTTVRLGKKDMYGRINEAYVSADWSQIRKFPAVEYPMFNMDAEAPSQIYHYSDYSPSTQYYGLPQWIGAWNAIQMDVEVHNYWLSNIRNGLNPSLFIGLVGDGTAEMRDEMYDQLREMYEGSDMAGSILLGMAASKDEMPEVTPINTNATDGAWTTVSDMVAQSILTGCKISSPMLLGIKTSGQLGGRDEIKTAADHFLRTVIAPYQNTLLNQFERILFMRDKLPIKLDIVQNELISE